MEESIQKQTTIFARYVDMFMEKLPSLIIAIITVIIGVIIAKVVKRMLTRFLKKYKSSVGLVSFFINLSQVTIIITACMQALSGLGVNTTSFAAVLGAAGFSIGLVGLVSFFINLSQVTIIITACMQALSGLGVNTTSFAAVLGAAGFSIGLAFKEVLANLGSCMIILFFKPFDIGDYIMCEGTEGTVYEIQMFSTTLKTNDNKLIIVPNTQVTTNPVINFTAQEKRRIDYVFNVEYDTDVKKLYEIANKLFDSDPSILNSPKPLIGVESMDNNIIRFVAKPWVSTKDYWDTYYRLMEAFKHEFDINGIELSRVHIVNGNK